MYLGDYVYLPRKLSNQEKPQKSISFADTLLILLTPICNQALWKKMAFSSS